MTVFVNVSGMEFAGVTHYGGEEEYWARVEGKEPPVILYKPRMANVAPRNDGWQPARSNTQTAPRTGPNKNQKPAAEQPRGPLFVRDPQKVLG